MTTTRKRPPLGLSLSERFWSQIEVAGECWLWRGLTTRGRIWTGRRYVAAYVFSFDIHKGPLPSGLMVCHTCDTPGCVRPDHLSAGTAEDNARDMVRKRRHWAHDPEMRAATIAKVNATKGRA